MGLPKTWQALARASARDVTRLQERALVRQARFEWPLIPHWREALARAGVDPLRVRRAVDLDPVGATAVTALRGVEPTHLRPLPDPGRLRRYWPASRKLALAFSGSKGGALLQRGYAVAQLDRVPVGGGFVTVESTPHDVRLEAQQGARALDLLGLAERDARVVVAAPAGFVARAFQGGGAAARAAVEVVEPAAELVAERLSAGDVDGLLAPRAVLDAALARGAGSLRVVAPTDGPTPREVRAAWRGSGLEVGDLAPLPLARLLLVEEKLDDDGPLGLVVFPDLALVEPGRGNALTHLAQRGTTLVRTTGALPPGELVDVGPARRGRTLPRWIATD